MTPRPLFQTLKAFLFAGILLAVTLSLYSCSGQPPSDPYCSHAPLLSGTDVKTGQGALQVEGTTNAYFYVFDASGKQVGTESLNKTLGLNAGNYLVKVNNGPHTVAVEKGQLTKCSTGTLMVSGTTSDYYYVMDSNNQQLHTDLLGKASSFFPSTVRVKVNNTEVPAEVKLNQVTEIKAGTLIVRGGTNEYYYVFDALGKQLNTSLLEKPLAFVQGSYTVKVNNTETKAAITGGQVTELKTGTILVKGSTDEYYYVFDSLGKQLNTQSINKGLAFSPGTLRIRVNNTDMAAEVAAGEIREYPTGSLVVPGSGSDYYYVFDKNGNQLNTNSVNKALAFFPGEYSVKLGQNSHPASVTAGQTTTVTF
jgi:6,7-dimethyl-8-ribityllumazine synthase